ncbi:nucleotidyltransferase domain-containing protein [Pantoea endophytica]
MSLKEIVKELKAINKKIKEDGVNSVFCIFGSALYGEIMHDVDILILYDNEKEVFRIRKRMEKICCMYPLDVYYMARDEEKELDFINKVKAIDISSI